MRRVWKGGGGLAAPGIVTLGVAALLVAGAAGGAGVLALTGGDEPGARAAASASGTTGTTSHDHAATGDDGASAPGGGGRVGRGAQGGRHAHPRLEPYDQRYAAASPDEQHAADDLLARTREAVAAYPDPTVAEAAGYRPPRNPRGAIHHYLNRELVDDGDVLDPARPEGLLFTDGPDGPELIGAFFVAPAGAEVPAGAGDLVSWHSHDTDCPGFFATADDPCTDTRRMLHVWTAESVEFTRRRGGEAINVDVADPFGAPFAASVVRARD